MKFVAPPRRYLATVVPLVGLVAAMTALVAYSPTLYRMFCAATGFGGTTQRADSAPVAAGSTASEMVVSFDSNVGDGLNWDFYPAVRSMKVALGVPTQANFIAHNRSDKTIVGRAVYNVAPYQVAPYFFKVQCFCFTSEKLGPGETAEMPVVFYVDKDLAKDPEVNGVREVTLSYTFYPDKESTPEAVSRARNLAQGSKQQAAVVGQADGRRFDNDAPRR